MKKIIGLFLVCLLGACSPFQNHKKRPIPDTDKAFYTQKMDTVPWPWVQMIPSERAAAFEGLDFFCVDQLVRLGMVTYPEKFEKISLVLVDYTVLPEKKPFLPKTPHPGLKFSEKYITVPKRYLLELRFYDNKRRPPAEPLYKGTVVMPPKEAYFLEALPFMVDSLMFELGVATSAYVYLELDSRTTEIKKSNTARKKPASPAKSQPQPQPAAEEQPQGQSI